MAKNKKGQIFYQVTREKPEGISHVLLIGGSVGAALGFFSISLIGALNGTEMDDLVFYFILSTIVGFLTAGLVTWLFVRNFSKVISASSMLTEQASGTLKTTEPAAGAPEVIDGGAAVIPGEEDKGQSVDFVFPELSPDK